MADKPITDWFPAPGEPGPMQAAQRAMRPPALKRFYQSAEIEARDGAHHLLLDGRAAKTPARHPLAVPTRALGDLLAAEWQAQGAEIDPAAMPVTRIVNSAIDSVIPQRQAVIDGIAKYAGSDLTCYRAGDPERLVEAQAQAWDPILLWAREELAAQFILSQGVMPVTQPPGAIEAVRRRLEAVGSPFRLAALHVMTTLTGSVLIALAHAAGRIDADAAWAAAHVDEIFQEGLWGSDDEAIERRAARRREFEAASKVYAAG